MAQDERTDQQARIARSFALTEGSFLIHARCPRCNGNAQYDDGDIRCLMCGSNLHPVAVAGGRVVRLTLLSVPATLSRAAERADARERRSTHFALSREDGSTGLASRVLRLVPAGPAYTVVERIATQIHVHRDDVRAALHQLEADGHVQHFSFSKGYRTGWRRAAR
jgi:uncharacterized Zn finger protein (UPF0148 family)